MNYNSVLGPIDPQVMNKEGRFVPALGYLGKIKPLIEKVENDTISEAEFAILTSFDLAELSLYEQAVELTTDLLEKWLAEYKFKDWGGHSDEEKKTRANEIARELANYERWKSHGRPLSIDVLRSLRLKIDDFEEINNLNVLIPEFHAVCEDFMELAGIEAFIFSRSDLL